MHMFFEQQHPYFIIDASSCCPSQNSETCWSHFFSDYNRTEERALVTYAVTMHLCQLKLRIAACWTPNGMQA